MHLLLTSVVAMAKKNLAELLIDTLAAAGVKRVYGLAGDSLNGITDVIRTDERIKWIALCSTGSQFKIVALFAILQRLGQSAGHALRRGFGLAVNLVKGEDTSGVTE